LLRPAFYHCSGLQTNRPPQHGQTQNVKDLQHWELDISYHGEKISDATSVIVIDSNKLNKPHLEQISLQCGKQWLLITSSDKLCRNNYGVEHVICFYVLIDTSIWNEFKENILTFAVSLANSGFSEHTIPLSKLLYTKLTFCYYTFSLICVLDPLIILRCQSLAFVSRHFSNLANQCQYCLQFCAYVPNSSLLR